MKALLNVIILCLLLINSNLSYSQKHNLYDPEKNALNQLDHAVQEAKKQNKHVLVQVGGNWCPWCIKLHSFIQEHSELDSIISADYIPVRINYSKENKNKAALEQLEYPGRFGFPVLVILDAGGSRIHTQDTGLLESGNGYDYAKLKRFLLSWNRKAVEP